MRRRGLQRYAAILIAGCVCTVSGTTGQASASANRRAPLIAPSSSPARWKAPQSATPVDRIDDNETNVRRRADGTWEVPLSITGVGTSRFRLSGEVGDLRIQLPVPPGLEPIAVEGQVRMSADVDSGFVEYVPDGGYTSTIVLDPEQTIDGQDVSIDLTSGTTQNNKIGVTFHHRLRTNEESCVTTLIGAWAEVEGIYLLTGDPQAPTEVKQFASALMSELVIVVPDQPTASEMQAAMTVSLAMIRASLNSQVTITSISASQRSTLSNKLDPLTTRIVSIDDAATAGASLDLQAKVPTLSLGGGGSGGAQLIRQADTLSSDLVAFAIGNPIETTQLDVQDQGNFNFDEISRQLAVDGNAGATPSATTTTVAGDSGEAIVGMAETFEGLGLIKPARSGLGQMELQLSSSQSAFGEPVDKMDVHLEIAHSAVPKGATATVTVLVNDLIRSSAELTADSRATFDFGLIGTTLTRDTTITINVQYTPPGGFCRPGEVPLIWQVDYTRSTLSGRFGQGIDAGFNRFPQVLVGGFEVGFESLDAQHLSLGIGLIAALQRAAGTPLVPTVAATISDALASPLPSILISRTNQEFMASNPLLDTGPLRVAEPQRRSQVLDVQLSGAYAVLQAYESFGVDHLGLSWEDSATSNGLDLASTLVKSMNTRQVGFRQLFGEVYLISEGTPAASISLRGDSTFETPLRSAPEYRSRILPLLIAIAGLLGIALLIWLFLRRRRRRLVATPAESDHQEHTDLDRRAPEAMAALRRLEDKQDPT